MAQRISVYTLVDVSEDSALQLQNHNALLQTVSLRGNPLRVLVTKLGNQDMQKYQFGINFGGNQNVWKFDFETDQTGLFNNKLGDLGGLVQDLHQVPVITKLLESVNIDPPIFDTSNEQTINTYFEAREVQ